jgi:hypothetical protein
VTTDSTNATSTPETSLSEDLLDPGGGDNGGFVEEEVRLYADGDGERAEWLGLPVIGVGQGVDGRPVYASKVKVFVDARADREPSAPNVVTIDQARLTHDALGLRANGDLPVRSGLEDTGSATRIEVAISVGVLVSEAILHGDVK